MVQELIKPINDHVTPHLRAGQWARVIGSASKPIGKNGPDYPHIVAMYEDGDVRLFPVRSGWYEFKSVLS